MHERILSVLFEVMGSPTFFRLSPHNKENKRKAMSILYDFIFLFEGEPAQLLQSNCGRVSYPTFRGKFEHFLATYFEDKPIA